MDPESRRWILCFWSSICAMGCDCFPIQWWPIWRRMKAMPHRRFYWKKRVSICKFGVERRIQMCCYRKCTNDRISGHWIWVFGKANGRPNCRLGFCRPQRLHQLRLLERHHHRIHLIHHHRTHHRLQWRTQCHRVHLQAHHRQIYGLKVSHDSALTRYQSTCNRHLRCYCHISHRWRTIRATRQINVLVLLSHPNLVSLEVDQKIKFLMSEKQMHFKCTLHNSWVLRREGGKLVCRITDCFY